MSRINFLVGSISGGGAEKQLLLIARGLASRGLCCSIWVFSDVPPTGRLAEVFEQCMRAGVEIHFLSPVRAGFAYLPLFLRLLTGDRSTHWFWTWGYRAEVIRLLLVPWARGVFSIRSASESQAYRWRWILRIGRLGISRYISNSHLGVAIADRVAPGIAAKARVVPNALEASFLNATTPLGARPAVLEVLMLGNVRYSVKGYDLALIVGRKIRDAGLPIRIRIGGAQYANETDLQAEISQAGLADFVSWSGPIKDSLTFLQGGHAFMLLSRYEGMPNALFEAMAVGLPCVATAVGDLPYYAQESDGLKVVPIEDAEAAFREVCRIWNNWDEAVAMGRRAKRFCQERFSEERMITDVIKALELEPASSGRRVEI